MTWVHGQVEEMLEKASIDWEGELQRLLEPAGSEKGVPVMLIEGGSLAVYNAYDRRYDSFQCVNRFELIELRRDQDTDKVPVYLDRTDY